MDQNMHSSKEVLFWEKQRRANQLRKSNLNWKIYESLILAKSSRSDTSFLAWCHICQGNVVMVRLDWVEEGSNLHPTFFSSNYLNERWWKLVYRKTHVLGGLCGLLKYFRRCTLNMRVEDLFPIYLQLGCFYISVQLQKLEKFEIFWNIWKR